jgi:hypothetical protein
MDREINLSSILALDAEIIRLKRTRNSLLNVTRIPPEIIGHIFCFSIMKVGDPDFARIKKGSYNFLLVCRHWFQVALHTPELWSSWGNNLEDWKRWYLRSGTSALDLTLDEWNYRGHGSLDEAIRDAIRDRAVRNVIRKVHLRSRDTELLTAIISSLIPEGEDVRPSSIESIVLNDVDVSDLFARHHFPKLYNLCLSGRFKISSWDHLKSTTIALTDLSLGFADTTPSSAIPTTSQILSLLASNPNLRSLALRALRAGGGGDCPGPQLPLRRLERILLTGAFHHIFPIIHRLEFPERMDDGEILLEDCTPQEVLEVIRPYIRDYLRRDARFRDRLGMCVSSTPHSISFHASVVGVGHNGPNRPSERGPPYRKFTVAFSQPSTHDAAEKLCFEAFTIPLQESIVSFATHLSVTEEILAMPNLEALCLFHPVVSNGFLLPDPDGPNAGKKLLPSLRRLYLANVEAEDDNWDPLVTYLTHQTSGGQIISLEIFGDWVHTCSKVITQIEGLVEEVSYLLDPYQKGPFDKYLYEPIPISA